MSVDFSKVLATGDKDAAVASCLIQGVPETLFEKAANLYQGVEHTESTTPSVVNGLGIGSGPGFRAMPLTPT